MRANRLNFVLIQDVTIEIVNSPLPLLFAIPLLLSSCQSAYYAGMETLGHEKRNILVSRVSTAKESQLEAKDQFSVTRDEFVAVTGYKGNELESRYRSLEKSYVRARSRADDVKLRNYNVEKTGRALFAEWEKEINEYQDPALKADSERKLYNSKVRLTNLTMTMRRAEARLDPVLAQFRDQLLYLKHNLNAQAVVTLRGRASKLDQEVNLLIRDLERSVADSEAFIREMQ